ncbi:MAG: hypothetical protein LBV44_06580 [Methylobacillus sp.]|jgi:hypothetical protein|nr:hypothetical protein [Methylobacillus sp.]
MKKIFWSTIIFIVLVFPFVGCERSSEERLPSGTVVTENPDGSQELHYADGRVVLKKPGGSLEIHRPDGGVILNQPDGSSELHFPDGLVMARKPDGSWESHFPSGRVVLAAPGNHQGKLPDGNVVLLREDGGVEIRFKNGRAQLAKLDGSFSSGAWLNNVPGYSDVVVSFYTDGSASRIQKDGSVMYGKWRKTSRDEDELRFKNGTVETVWLLKKDGSLEERFEAPGLPRAAFWSIVGIVLGFLALGIWIFRRLL